MAKSRRYYDEDDEDDDYRPRRKRRRKKSCPSGLLILIIVLVPMLGVGIYFGVRAINQPSSKAIEAAREEDKKKSRARIIGDWYNDDPANGYHWELNIRDGGQITIAGKKGTGNASLTIPWEVTDGSKDRITIRMPDPYRKGESFDYDIEILSDQQIRVTPKKGTPPVRVYNRAGK